MQAVTSACVASVSDALAQKLIGSKYSFARTLKMAVRCCGRLYQQHLVSCCNLLVCPGLTQQSGITACRHLHTAFSRHLLTLPYSCPPIVVYTALLLHLVALPHSIVRPLCCPAAVGVSYRSSKRTLLASVPSEMVCREV